MADLEEDSLIDDSYAQSIADRDSWLRSFGVTPYTAGREFWTKMDKENVESRKIRVLMGETVDNLPPCEKMPGQITDDFKQHLDILKQDCLTSVNWSGARNQIHHAIQQNTIDKMIVLGSASIFDFTSDHLFWRWEMAFILAIFELVTQQAQNRKSGVPQLIFQDPAFCTADHRLLNGLGGQVLEDPMAFACIDKHTLVFAKHIPLVVYFTSLLMTSPAVCISTNIKAATEGALRLKSTHRDFGPSFDICEVADKFMAGRKTADLPEAMVRLYNDTPGHELDNFVASMAVMWVESEAEKKMSVREEKQMGSLGEKAKKWLDSL